jgi:hypothetical protein
VDGEPCGLAERSDVPVFGVERDESHPFPPGLPVLEGSRAEEIQRRFILVDVKWQ